MPSMINDLALAELQSIVDENASLMLVESTNLKAEESLALRKQLFDVGASIKVAKARLVKRAVGDDVAAHVDAKGSLAIVSGEDIAAAAKIIRDLAKEEKVAVRAGKAEGTALDGQGALRLADLPSKQEARALVARAIRAPVVKLGKLLKAPYRRVGRALMAHKEKLEG